MTHANRQHNRVAIALALSLVTTLVIVITIVLFYRFALSRQLQHMEKEVQGFAGLMESVVQFDLRHSARTHPQESWGETMSQIESGLTVRALSTSTEDIYIGRKVRDQLSVVQVIPSKGFSEITRVAFDGRLAQGLYRGLNGETGSGEVIDFHGRRALVAYAPVPSLGIALSNHIVLDEFHAPFYRAAGWAAGIGLLLAGMATFGLMACIRPLQRRPEASEHHSRARIATTPVGVYETDSNGSCIDVNEQWCELAGMSRQEALGSGWLRALYPDDAPAVQTAWQAFVEQRAPFNLEYRFLRPNGEIRWLSGQAVALSDANNRITGYTGTITDVTGLKNAQNRFNEAQRLAKVGSWELDLLNNHLHWSDEIFRIFEIDKTRFGASYEAFLNAIHPDDREAVNQAYTDSLTTRRPYEIVHRLQMADGRIKYVRETCESFFDDSGKPLRSVGTVQDITELHKAELELREHREHLEELVAERTARLAESERQLRQAQEIAWLGHWTANLQTGTLDWSDQIYQIFGRDPGHFRPSIENFYVCVHPDDHELVRASEIEASQSGQHSVDHRIVLPDGTIRWVHEEAQMDRDDDGQPLRLTGTVQDITARKQAEFELIAAKEAAERANKAKSEFLSRMSHELRTPMNAILGFAQVLELDRLKPEQLEFVHEIHRAGDHLLELINELLDLSRIEAGKLAIALQPVSVRMATAESAQIVQPMIREKEIVLINNCDKDANVLADPTRLRQILVNLLSNAAKYNRQGGRILVTCQPLGDNRLRIAVTDTGPGIAREKLAGVFKPFERLGAEFSAVDGTGIGLALSSQLAELMDGTVGLDSTPGEGSTFWIDLAATPEGARIAVAGDKEGRTKDETADLTTVLYIEDNTANLRVVEAMFRHQPNLRLLSATNGEYGLEMAQHYLPRAILLDIHLPGMDGYAVLDALRSNNATRDIPVIAVSADAMPIDIERGRRAGFVEYLTKPVKAESLVNALQAALKNQAAKTG
jgi:PAS domain S-box-containing protein